MLDYSRKQSLDKYFKNTLSVVLCLLMFLEDKLLGGDLLEVCSDTQRKIVKLLSGMTKKMCWLWLDVLISILLNARVFIFHHPVSFSRWKLGRLESHA